MPEWMGGCWSECVDGSIAVDGSAGESYGFSADAEDAGTAIDALDSPCPSPSVPQALKDLWFGKGEGGVNLPHSSARGADIIGP